jgi:hypothetical protein
VGVADKIAQLALQFFGVAGEFGDAAQQVAADAGSWSAAGARASA